MTDPAVDICLATYNGAQFLPALYESLAAQSLSTWRLLVRDDGSADGTQAILDRFGRMDPRVVQIHDNLGNLGVVGNFGALLMQTRAEHVMLADQDDVWYPTKIQASMREIRALDAKASGTSDSMRGRPHLVFTDLHVVDADLNLISESFISFQHLDSLRHPSFVRLLTQNVAPGCTLIMNRALLEAALPLPSEAVMHDWWMMLVAAAIGEIGYLNEPTAAYRQHAANVIGVKSARLWNAAARLSSYRSQLRHAEVQAQALLNRLGDRMRPGDFAAASTMAALSTLPPARRRIEALRNGLSKSGLLRKIAFYSFM